jgi:predicted ArsR family transcriptional regulator
MQSTRQRILDYLEQRGAASARQLAQAFGMTPANLRRHLGILRARGLLAAIERRPPEGRGRPEQIYALTATAQPDNLKQLSSALLEQTRGRGQEARMKHLAVRLLGNLPTPVGQITQRLVAAVQRLAPLGYRPRWEARPDAPQVVLGRCPYAAIIADHPELCRMDAHMLEALLAAPVEQLSKLQPGPQGTRQCVFTITDTSHTQQ